jgi:hypothetical protein
MQALSRASPCAKGRKHLPPSNYRSADTPCIWRLFRGRERTGNTGPWGKILFVKKKKKKDMSVS